jgi:hypothetical protein
VLSADRVWRCTTRFPYEGVVLPRWVVGRNVMGQLSEGCPGLLLRATLAADRDLTARTQTAHA